MSKLTTREIDNKKEWENFLSKHDEANFLQSWNWGEFHKNIKNEIFRIGFFEDKILKGIMLCVLEKAKRATYLTIPGGPIIDWQDKNQIEDFVEESKKLARTTKSVFVRVRPQLNSEEFSKELFRKNGFKDAPMHLHAELTSQLKLNLKEEELLSNMRKSTRYEIKKAQSIGIKIIKRQEVKDIQGFYDLQVETAKRQGFVPFSYNYLQQQFEVFAKVNEAILFSAEHQNKLLAQAFVIFYGSEAVYHYGASTDLGRKYPGAYLIQWEAIKEAKKRGIKRYNFWGVSPETDKSHRFQGLSLFKRGFGGEDMQYLHAQDLIINSVAYSVNFAIESVRKRIRRV